MRKFVWTAYIAIVCAWALLAYVGLFKWFGDETLLAKSGPDKVFVADFVNVYSAAVLTRRALNGSVDIYDPKVQDRSVRELINPVNPELPFYLQYPPHFFLLMLPLSIFSMYGAWLAWNLVHLVIIGFCLAWLTRDMTDVKQRWTAGLLLVGSYPYWLSFEHGQTSLTELALWCPFLWALMHRKHALAGVLAAFASIKLQYAPYLGVCGLFVGGWKFVAGGLGAAAVLMAASAMVLGVGNVAAYPHALLFGETGESARNVFGVTAVAMQNIRGALCLMIGEDSRTVHAISLASMALAGLFLTYLWWRARPLVVQDQILFRMMAGLTILVALTTSLHTHAQDYIMAAIPCLWFWQLEGDDKDLRLLKKLIVIFPVIGWVFIILPQLTHWKVQWLFIWGVAAAILCLRLTWRRIFAVQADLAHGEPSDKK